MTDQTNPLKAFRERHGLSQEQAAPIFGLKRRAYQSLEAAEAIPQWVDYCMTGYEVKQAQAEAEAIAEWAATAKSLLEGAPSIIKTYPAHIDTGKGEGS